LIYEWTFPRSSAYANLELFPHRRHEDDKEPSSHLSPGRPLGRRSLFKVVITFGRCFWYSGALFRELLSSQFKLRRGATVFAGGPNRPRFSSLPDPLFSFCRNLFALLFSPLPLLTRTCRAYSFWRNPVSRRIEIKWERPRESATKSR